MSHDCSSHDGDRIACEGTPICQFDGDNATCVCNTVVSESADRRQCTCSSRSKTVFNSRENACICPDGYGADPKNPGVCAQCEGESVHAKSDSETGPVACTACNKTTEVANSKKTFCTCAGGYGNPEPWLYGEETCEPCPDGMVARESRQNSHKMHCTTCIKSWDDGPANLAKTNCIGKNSCGENTEVKQTEATTNGWHFDAADQCVCKKNYRLTDDRTACVPGCPPGQVQDDKGDCVTPGPGPNLPDQGREELQCNPTTEVANDAGTACVCAAGYGLSNGACEFCPEGYVHSEDTTETEKKQCMGCAYWAANLARTECYSSKRDCGANASDKEVKDPKYPWIANRYCACNEGYRLSDDHTQCIGCPPSKTEGENGECFCTPGANTQPNMNDECVCIDGHGVAKDDPNVCVPCPEGSVHKWDPAEATRVECTKCVDNTVPSVDMTQCIAADACGEHAVLINGQCACTGGYQLIGGTCSQCDDGFVSADGDNTCTQCQQGTEAANDGRTVCLCAGGYGAENGSSTCLQCPDGKVHAEDKGEAGKVGCKACEDGVANFGRTGCQAAKECEDLGGTVVTKHQQCACAAGYGLNANRMQCSVCPDGSVSAAGTNICTKCNPATETPNKDRTKCVTPGLAATTVTAITVSVCVLLVIIIVVVTSIVLIIRRRKMKVIGSRAAMPVVTA